MSVNSGRMLFSKLVGSTQFSRRGNALVKLKELASKETGVQAAGESPRPESSHDRRWLPSGRMSDGFSTAPLKPQAKLASVFGRPGGARPPSVDGLERVDFWVEDAKGNGELQFLG